MENAGLVTLSGQLVLRRQLDVIANNVANMNTTGFKREMLDVTSTSLTPSTTNAFPRADRLDRFASDWTSSTEFDQGAIQTTGAPLDVAISGKAFFAVQTANGTEEYTRDGSFQINAQGQLVTKDGNAVLSSNGPVTFAQDETNVVISRDGTIATSAGVKGKLSIVSFGDNKSLKKIGQNLFTGSNAQPDDTSQILQGAIETSNVQPVVEMTRMIDVTRTYEMLTNLMKNHDDMRSKAIDQLGKLSS